MQGFTINPVDNLFQLEVDRGKGFSVVNEIISASGGASTILFGASSSSTIDGSATLTFAHTVGIISNRILVVSVAIFSAASPYPTITGITYSGSPLTFLRRQNSGDASLRIGVEMWYLINPPSGTANIIITASQSVKMVGAGVSYSGVHQTTPFTASNGAGGNSTTPSVAVVSAVGEMVVDVVGVRGAAGQLLIAGAGQTQRFSGNTGADTTHVFAAGSEEVGAASVTMSWTASVSQQWAIVGGSLQPASIVATDELPFLLVKNPVASGKNIRFRDMVIGAGEITVGKGNVLRVYRNPTITANGTALTINKLKSSGSSPIANVFKLSTLSDFGTEVFHATYTNDSFREDFDLGFFIEQNENVLITMQATDSGKEQHIFLSWIEQ